MRTSLSVAVVVCVVSVASVSFAQAPPPPGTIPVYEQPSAAYPRELVDRPILIPRGLEAELSLGSSFSDGVDLFDFVGLNAGARAGNGQIEVFANVGLRAVQPDGSSAEDISDLSGGLAMLVAPDQVLRGRVTIFEPTSDTFNIINAQGTYEIKRKLNPQLAVVATGGAEFVNVLLDPEPVDPIWIMSFMAGAEAQFQATPQLAATGGGTILIPLANSPDELETETVVNIGFGGLASLGPNFDAFGRVVFFDAFDGDQRSTGILAGVLVRP